MSSRPSTPRATARSPLRRLAPLAFAVLTGLATLATAPAGAVASSPATASVSTATATATAATTGASVTSGTATAADIAAMLLSSMNADRSARGLVPYRSWPATAALATERAARMAAAHTLSHIVAGGNVGDALDADSIPWISYGEIIGATSYPWGSESAADLYARWKASAPHWSIMMSDTYNYVGIGVVQADDGSTWVSEVMTESPDHSVPVARNGSSGRSGTTIRFSWSGSDPRLQTHTAGLRSFDLQFRWGTGPWRTIRDDTTSTSISIGNRAHGHWYGFRVQAKDRRGNLSKWTSEVRIWVP